MNAKIESGQLLAPLVGAIRKDIDVEWNNDDRFWNEHLEKKPTAEEVIEILVAEGPTGALSSLELFAGDILFSNKDGHTLSLLRQACKAADKRLLASETGDLATDQELQDMAGDAGRYQCLGLPSLASFASFAGVLVREDCQDEAVVLAALTAFWRVLGVEEVDESGEPILS